MIMNAYSLKKIIRDNKPHFVVLVRCEMLDSSKIFSNLETALFHIETVKNRMSKYNIVLSENNRMRIPKNIKNAYINEKNVFVYNSIDEYRQNYCLA